MTSFSLRQLVWLVFSVALLLSPAAQAERRMDTDSILIHGEKLRFFHLHDGIAPDDGPIILLLSGSGCGDFSQRFASFFELYPPPLNVWLLDKPGIKPGADMMAPCSNKFSAHDFLQHRVDDNLAFLAQHPVLKVRPPRSIAVLGFSEGGTVAPVLAAASDKIGWLATAGSGGLPQGEEFMIFAKRGVPPFGTPFSRKYLLKEYAAIKRDPASLKKEFFGHPYRYWSSFLFLDPLQTYARLDMPMVAAMGEKDDSVPIESGRALRDYFVAHPDKNFRYIEFPNASHGLRTPESNGAQLFVAALARWFKGDAKAFDDVLPKAGKEPAAAK